MNYLDGIYTVREDEKVRRFERVYLAKPVSWREVSVLVALTVLASFNGIVA